MLFIGWIVQSKINTSIPDSILLIIMIIIFLSGNLITIFYLKNRFIVSHEDLIRIEECLKLYQPNIFTDDGKPLYPKRWQKVSKGIYFINNSILLSIMALTAILVLLF